MPQWAIEVLHSVAFCRTASRAAAVLAGVAGAAGVVAVVLYVVQDREDGSGIFAASNTAFVWGPALTILQQTAFYAGLLVAASALLRLQASRLESEVFGEELGAD